MHPVNILQLHNFMCCPHLATINIDGQPGKAHYFYFTKVFKIKHHSMKVLHTKKVDRLDFQRIYHVWSSLKNNVNNPSCWPN